MKKIKIEKTKITENKVKFQGDASKELDYKDLIEMALDVVPQGGFTPKDIRDRNRIQDTLDKATSHTISLEDNDFDNLDKIMRESRWTIRDSELNNFLQNFEDGVYRKVEEEKPIKK
jgi:hypothetical protein